MKKTLFFLSLFLFIIYWTGCKKCYTCHNVCTTCTFTYGGHALTHVLCNDSFSTTAEYNAAIANDSSGGFVCVSSTPSYSHDFCVNKPGDEEHYVNYWNEGGRAVCTAK